MKFSDNLKRIRNYRGMTQGDLERESGITVTNISRMERGQTEPNLSTIYKLMNALECDANSLLFSSEKLSIDNVLEETLKQVKNLSDTDKKIIIAVIEKFCAAHGIDKMLKEHMAIIQLTFDKNKRGLGGSLLDENIKK